MSDVHNLAADVRAFTSNVFLVDGERPVLVDAGANFDVVARLDARNVDVEAVILTHTHPDHVANVDALRDAFGIETWGFDPEQPSTDNRVADGETVRMGDHEYVALHTPGHKNDHLCFYAKEPGLLFAGDLVFQNGAYGRTDLPEGDQRLLVESIERLLDAVDVDLSEMHVGHGPSVAQRPRDHVEMALRMARSG